MAADWEEAVAATRQALAAYGELDKQRLGRLWTLTELLAGGATDYGDLAAAVLRLEGVRPGDGDRKQVEHELADLFWDILAVADRLEIDLPTVIAEEMTALSLKLQARLNEQS